VLLMQLPADKHAPHIPTCSCLHAATSSAATATGAGSVHKAAGGLTSLATPQLPDAAPAAALAYPPVTPLGIGIPGAGASASAGATDGKDMLYSNTQAGAASSTDASTLEVVPVAPAFPEASGSSGFEISPVAAAVSGGASPRGPKSPASSPRRGGPRGAMRRRPDLSGLRGPER
jgi:hypothetical protein